MNQVVGLPSNSYKPIINTVCVRARLCKLQKRCTRLASVSDKAYQLVAHGRWFSPSTPASSTTKTSRHDIVEILLKVAINTIKSNQIKSKHNTNKQQKYNLVCTTRFLNNLHRELSLSIDWKSKQLDVFGRKTSKDSKHDGQKRLQVFNPEGRE